MGDIVPAEQGWRSVKRAKNGGPDIEPVLYWVHGEQLQVMTPRGQRPAIAEAAGGWYFLVNPDGLAYVPGGSKTLTRLELEEWVGERGEK